MDITNIIEGLNRQYRKVAKTKSVFSSDAALEKMRFLAYENVVKKWTQRHRNWNQVLNQLIVLYGDRLTNYSSYKNTSIIFFYQIPFCILPLNNPWLFGGCCGRIVRNSDFPLRFLRRSFPEDRNPQWCRTIWDCVYGGG